MTWQDTRVTWWPVLLGLGVIPERRLPEVPAVDRELGRNLTGAVRTIGCYLGNLVSGEACRFSCSCSSNLSARAFDRSWHTASEQFAEGGREILIAF